MKVTLFFATLMVSGSLYAESWLMYCGDVKVSIKNEVGLDCVLKQQQKLHGKLVHGTQVPDVIFRDQTVQFDLASYENKEHQQSGIVLTYQCGDDREITLLSNSNSHQNYSFYSHNLKATYTYNGCNNFTAKANELNWTVREGLPQS